MIKTVFNYLVGKKVFFKVRIPEQELFILLWQSRHLSVFFLPPLPFILHLNLSSSWHFWPFHFDHSFSIFVFTSVSIFADAILFSVTYFFSVLTETFYFDEALLDYVLVFYYCIANCHKISGLRQQINYLTISISRILSIEYLGPVLRASPDWNQGVGQSWVFIWGSGFFSKFTWLLMHSIEVVFSKPVGPDPLVLHLLLKLPLKHQGHPGLASFYLLHRSIGLNPNKGKNIQSYLQVLTTFKGRLL